MTTALQLAAEVLPHFTANVLGQQVHTYGFYAHAIGRDAAKESMVIGKAMHVVGAACIIARVPVAPIHYVKRADGEWRGIFERAVGESIHVLPAWDTLAISARLYKYTEADFKSIAKLLHEGIPQCFPPSWQSPSQIWKYLIYTVAEGNATWLRRALVKYEAIIDAERHRRRKK